MPSGLIVHLSPGTGFWGLYWILITWIGVLILYPYHTFWHGNFFYFQCCSWKGFFLHHFRIWIDEGYISLVGILSELETPITMKHYDLLWKWFYIHKRHESEFSSMTFEDIVLLVSWRYFGLFTWNTEVYKRHSPHSQGSYFLCPFPLPYTYFSSFVTVFPCSVTQRNSLSQ